MKNQILGIVFHNLASKKFKNHKVVIPSPWPRELWMISYIVWCFEVLLRKFLPIPHLLQCNWQLTIDPLALLPDFLFHGLYCRRLWLFTVCITITFHRPTKTFLVVIDELGWMMRAKSKYCFKISPLSKLVETSKLFRHTVILISPTHHSSITLSHSSFWAI